jgi:tetrahydromethanopterin S-methyltransferase subunit B
MFTESDDYHQGAKEGFYLGIRYGVLIGAAVTGMLMLIIELCD